MSIKRKLRKFDMKWVITHVLLEFYLSFCLLNLEGKEVLTSAFIASLNPPSSLFKICTFQALLPWYPSFFQAHGVNQLNFPNKMASC